MFWKMRNSQLKIGYSFASYGDRVPFFKRLSKT